MVQLVLFNVGVLDRSYSLPSEMRNERREYALDWKQGTKAGNLAPVYVLGLEEFLLSYCAARSANFILCVSSAA